MKDKYLSEIKKYLAEVSAGSRALQSESLRERIFEARKHGVKPRDICRIFENYSDDQESSSGKSSRGSEGLPEKLFLVQVQEGEYEIIRGVHPFNSRKVYHTKVSFVQRPINHAGYYVVQLDNEARYVFEADEKPEANKKSLDSAVEKIRALAEEDKLEPVDLTGHLKIYTTYPIRKIPFVPNAVRGLPFTLKPVKR